MITPLTVERLSLSQLAAAMLMSIISRRESGEYPLATSQDQAIEFLAKEAGLRPDLGLEGYLDNCRRGWAPYSGVLNDLLEVWVKQSHDKALKIATGRGRSEWLALV